MSRYNETFIASPLSIPGCRVWYDASDATSHTYSSGSNISALTDKSGNGNNFSGSGTAIVGTIGNSLVSISNFNGTTSLPHGISGNNPMTYVFVEKFHVGGGLFYRGNTTAGGGNGYTGSYNGSNTYSNGVAQTGINQVTGLISVSGRPILSKLIISIWDGSVSRLWETGTLLGTSGTTTLNQPSATTIFQPANPWELGEFFIFGTALSDTQRQYLEGILAWKWNMVSNLSNTHPFYTRRPVAGDPFPSASIPPRMTQYYNFSPSSLSRMVLWLDASDQAYMGVSSGMVSSLRDKSNTGKTLTLAFTNLYNITTSSMNGLSTLLYPNDTADNNATRTYFNTNSYAYTSASNTIFWMIRMNPYVLQGTSTRRGWGSIFPMVGTAVQGMQHGMTRQSVSNWTFTYAQANVGNILNYNSTVIVDNTTSAPVAFPALVTVGRLSPTLIQMSYYGRYFSATTGSFVFNSPSAFAIGSFFQNQELCELIHYDRSLTNSEILQVEGYLAWKWGVQSNLTPTHPFRNVPPYDTGIIAMTQRGGPRASVPAFSPSTLNTLRLWLDASDFSTVVTSSIYVTQWNDKSGCNYNLTQAVASNYPYYINSTIGFGSTMNGYLNVPQLAVNAAQGYSYFFALNPVNSTNWIFVKQHNTFNSYNLISMTRVQGSPSATSTNQHLYYRPNNTATYTSSSNAFSTNQLQLIGIHYDTRTLSMSRNGSTISATSTATMAINNVTNATNATLGCWISDSFGNSFADPGVTNFRLAEMLFYNGTLQPKDIQGIEGYLAWKWGLNSNLPYSHPYFSAQPIAPLVWPTFITSSLVVPPATYTRTFLYTGSVQTLTIPADVTSISVYMWGAGGGGAYIASGLGFTAGGGGAGAMVQGRVTVTPGATLFIVVGKGGRFAGVVGTEPQGSGGLGYYDSTSWSPPAPGNTLWGAGSGGGRSAIQFVSGSTDIVVAGGGGGGGAINNASARGGAATFSGTANGGQNGAAGGGSQSAGGAAGSATASAGSSKSGGAGYTSGAGGGGGGGGGYFGGGGGGYTLSVGYNPGGAGSSYTANLTAFSGQPLGYNSSDGTTGAAATTTYYLNGVATGGTGTNTAQTPDAAQLGGNGLVVVQFNSVISPTLSSYTVTFSYTGGDQTMLIPLGVTSVLIQMWGAGGGGNGTGKGGGGAYVEGTLTTTPGEALTILVGAGGQRYNTASAYGGGGGSATVRGSGAQGGGRSAIRRSATEIVTAGGGGGGGGQDGAYGGGAATVDSQSFGGDSPPGTQIQTTLSVNGQGGGGGSLTAGGVNGPWPNNRGSAGQFQGGTGGGDAGSGGGGGGYYGGGGGGYNGGGGAGSSYLANLRSTSNSASASRETPGNSASGLRGTAGAGGNNGTGGNGVVYITFTYVTP